MTRSTLHDVMSRGETPKAKRRRRPALEWLEPRNLLTTMQFTPVDDNTLYQNSSGNLSNGLGRHVYVGTTGQAQNNVRRAAIKFDLTSLPAGATINSATLTLNMSNAPSSSAQTIALHRVLHDWGEGTSNAGLGGSGSGEGDGIQATTGDVTWVHTFFNTKTWTTAGGDFVATPSASTSVSGAGSYQWIGAGLVADVQQWFTDPATNFGWIATGNESSSRTVKQFDSKDHVNSAVRPQLIIDFTAPAQLDFGDAPDTYGTLSASDGARHMIGGPHLGATVDAESDGQPSSAADGDHDDNGVFSISSVVALPTSATTASFRVVASQSAKLDAWIDFNQNGTFDQPAEVLGGGTGLDLGAGDNLVAVTIPAGAKPGLTYGRFRISSAGGLGPKGSAANGEVEDYALTILEGSSAPVATLDLPSGSNEITVSGTDLVARRGTKELFRVPASAVSRLDVSSTLADAAISATGGWTLGPPLFVGTDFFRVVAQNNVLVRIAGLHPWQNPVEHVDVNGSGNVTSLDVLLGINWINTRGSGNLPVPPTPSNSPDGNYLDTNGDDKITPADVLTTIDIINNQPAGAAEGEGGPPPLGATSNRQRVPAAEALLAFGLQESPTALSTQPSAPERLTNAATDRGTFAVPFPAAAQPLPRDLLPRTAPEVWPDLLDAGQSPEQVLPLEAALQDFAPAVAGRWFNQPRSVS